jgi:nucleotide-binding universal stress UspA family protein
VVGVDCADVSSAAIRRAKQVGQESGAKVELVYAAARIPSSIAQALLGRARVSDKPERELLEKIRLELREEGVSARTHVLTGSPVAAIRHVTAQTGAALVIVGTRGRLLTDAVVGSTAERVATTARRPVLLVRTRAARAYRHVVVGADRRSDLRKSVAAARLVAPRADVSFLHAYEALYEGNLALHGVGKATLRRYRAEARNEARTAMVRRVREAGCNPKTLRLAHGDPRRVLEEASRRASVELLVLDRGESVMRHLLLGSVCRWVIEHGKSDVLLV